jgi:tripartite-type tricarboxylate transporter receptor subunit TctC
VLAMPDVNNHLTQMGLTVGFMTSQQLAQRERAYTQVWTKLIKASGFQPQ